MLGWNRRVYDRVMLGMGEVKGGVRVGMRLRNRLRERMMIGNGVQYIIE